jgi:bacterioferritin (cytochrome b1)
MADRFLVDLTADEILAALGRALAAEVQAVADYNAHAHACDSVDVREALETLRDVEREHARRLVLRISALGGKPAQKAAEPQAAGDTLTSKLEQDLKAEQWAIVEYARLIAGILGDEETVEMMTDLLADEMRHAQWLKAKMRALQIGYETAQAGL